MVEQTRRSTSRPFGVDFIVDETAFGPATTEDHLSVVLDHDVPVVVFFWHLPPTRWIERLKAARRQVWIQVSSVEAAGRAVAAGADAIIVQGAEAGGHNRSGTGTIAAVPATVDAVAPVPVLAAGGIADGRGVAAAMALGASAVVVGTRLIASTEAHAHPEYKKRVVAAGVEATVRTRLFGIEWPDQPMNVLRNAVVDAWSGPDDRTPAPEPDAIIGKTRLEDADYPMPRFSAILPTPETEGDLDQMCLAAGQSAALSGEVLPAGRIVCDMMDEAAAILGRLGREARSHRPLRPRVSAAPPSTGQ
jgi:enoyl-[acyl-carrier protein] reductase II